MPTNSSSRHPVAASPCHAKTARSKPISDGCFCARRELEATSAIQALTLENALPTHFDSPQRPRPSAAKRGSLIQARPDRGGSGCTIRAFSSCQSPGDGGLQHSATPPAPILRGMRPKLSAAHRRRPVSDACIRAPPASGGRRRVVPETGLEPALVAQPDPKSGASTNSATPAKGVRVNHVPCRTGGCKRFMAWAGGPGTAGRASRSAKPPAEASGRS